LQNAASKLAKTDKRFGVFEVANGTILALNRVTDMRSRANALRGKSEGQKKRLAALCMKLG